MAGVVGAVAPLRRRTPVGAEPRPLLGRTRARPVLADHGLHVSREVQSPCRPYGRTSREGRGRAGAAAPRGAWSWTGCPAAMLGCLAERFVLHSLCALGRNMMRCRALVLGMLLASVSSAPRIRDPHVVRGRPLRRPAPHHRHGDGGRHSGRGPGSRCRHRRDLRSDHGHALRHRRRQRAHHHRPDDRGEQPGGSGGVRLHREPGRRPGDRCDVRGHEGRAALHRSRDRSGDRGGEQRGGCLGFRRDSSAWPSTRPPACCSGSAESRTSSSPSTP